MANAHKSQKIWVLPGNGGLYLGELEHLDRSASFFREAALIATTVGLQWTDGALDLQALLPSYFLPEAERQVQEAKQQLLGGSDSAQRSSKPVILSISSPAAAGERRWLEVTGLLRSTSRVGGREVASETGFSLTLGFCENPDLLASGRYPWLVCDWSLVAEGQP